VKKGLILTLFIFLVFAHFTLPQSRTGVLTGRVSDEEGEMLPGVSVTVMSPALIQGSMGTLTNERGLYRFINLPPGEYSLRAEIQSFAPYEQRDIRVRLGITTTVNFSMRIGAISEEVEVIAETPVIDVESNKVSVNYDREFLAKLPTRRDLVSIMNLTPGVVVDIGADPAYPERASFGSGSRENYYSVDGTYLTDPGNGQPMIFWNYDIIEEAQIEGIGHPAEYGNSAGAVINIVTKTGGDNFSGLANFYYRNKSMRSDNYEGTGLDAPSNAIKSEWEGSFNLGGPIMKEKIWFFASGGLIPTNSETVGFTDDIERRQRFVFGKVTSQLGVHHKLALNYNYSYDRTNHMFASQFRTPDSTLNSRQWTSAFNLQWNYYINTNTLLEMRGAFVDRATTYISNAPGPSYNDLITGMMTESAGFHNEQTRARYQFQTSLSYWLEGFGGDHDLKLGFDFEQGESGYTGTMQSDYPGGPSFIYTLFGEPYISIAYEPETLRSNNIFRGLSGYIQDTWKIGTRLSLNIGARLSNIRSLIPEQENVTQAIEEYEFTNIEPRLGFVYDLSLSGRQMAVKGYYGRNFINSVALGLLNPNSWTVSQYLYIGGVPILIYKSSPSLVGVDPDLARPYSDTYVLGFEMSLTRNLAFRVNGIYKSSKSFIGAIDQNYTADTFSPVNVVDPITGSGLTIYNQMEFQDTYTYYTNPDEADRKYRALQFVLEKSFSNNYQFLLSYTWSKAEGMVQLGIWGGGGMSAGGEWNNPNMYVNSRGVLDLDKTHSIKLSGVYLAPYGITIGVNYVGQSGFPYQRYAGFELNQGLNYFSGELPGAQRTAFQHLIDLRIEKSFVAGKIQPRIFFEVFNLLNANTAISIGAQNDSPTYNQITAILPPRILRVGVGLQF